MVSRSELKKFLTELLRPFEFSDYGPNGLQIEGSDSIKKIAFAISATKDSISKSIELGADALIVHHGLFWKFHGTKTLTGPFAARVLPLVKNDINLFGYHLPLDAHLEIGNAATVAKSLDMNNLLPFGDYKGSPTGVKGKLSAPIKAADLKAKLESLLNHSVMLASPDEQQKINSVGIITGGANSEWYLAAKQGLDAYITGEMSEHDWNEAQEAGIHMFAGGHSATEQFGIQSLMAEVQNKFDLPCHFIKTENPA